MQKSGEKYSWREAIPNAAAFGKGKESPLELSQFNLSLQLL